VSRGSIAAVIDAAPAVVGLVVMLPLSRSFILILILISYQDQDYDQDDDSE
jgi:hypothetical protein